MHCVLVTGEVQGFSRGRNDCNCLDTQFIHTHGSELSKSNLHIVIWHCQLSELSECVYEMRKCVYISIEGV